jgi:hypothetical protein
MCSQTHGPSRGQIQIAVTVNANAKITYTTEIQHALAERSVGHFKVGQRGVPGTVKRIGWWAHDGEFARRRTIVHRRFRRGISTKNPRDQTAHRRESNRRVRRFHHPYLSACWRSTQKGGTMSASQAIKHARAVRQRLRHPRNAVADDGIDLKRKPVLTVIEPAPLAPDVAALPLGIGTPLPDYLLSYPAAPTVPLVLSVRTIQRAVCEHYAISLPDLLSGRRTRALVLARRVAVWLCRRLTPYSLPAIGHHFGGRDHTTMLHAARRIDELRQTDAAMQARLDAFIAGLSPPARNAPRGALGADE